MLIHLGKGKERLCPTNQHPLNTRGKRLFGKGAHNYKRLQACKQSHWYETGVIVITVVISKSHLALSLTPTLTFAGSTVKHRTEKTFLLYCVRSVGAVGTPHGAVDSCLMLIWCPAPTFFRASVDKTVQTCFPQVIHMAKEHLPKPTSNPTNTSPSTAPNRMNRMWQTQLPSQKYQAVFQRLWLSSHAESSDEARDFS